MKRCPTCDRTYTDPSLNFCLEDGTPLASDAPAYDPNATIRYPSARDTIEPPPTEIYHPEPAVTPPAPRRTTPTPTPPPPPPPQQWRPGPTAPPPQKKSNAIWWILGGLIAVIVVGGGLVVLFIALALSSTDNRNLNANSRNDNRNANVTTNTNNSNVNANTNANVPTLLTDDFSQQKWGTGQSAYGRIWYSNGEYHMTSLPEKFVVMYAPSNDYNTENATVKVTARTVNGEVPSAGFGLMVHCVQTRDKKLEDYALLIFPSADEPSYEVIMHKAGVQSALVQKTTSSAIRSGSSPNQLEIRIKGAELSFYANGQLLTKVTDTANFRRGRAGLYTSDPYEVAFDDLTIEH
ncbi:MAG TPA: hypothetical protein VJ306_07670 [Pyrinomonadaceae bacterium]|nr:hypothetical protein [Pyrinomonadaceae bacterium]